MKIIIGDKFKQIMMKWHLNKYLKYILIPIIIMQLHFINCIFYFLCTLEFVFSNNIH